MQEKEKEVEGKIVVPMWGFFVFFCVWMIIQSLGGR
jgi:hypothetical protein